jgi:hypothetical protein
MLSRRLPRMIMSLTKTGTIRIKRVQELEDNDGNDVDDCDNGSTSILNPGASLHFVSL